MGEVALYTATRNMMKRWLPQRYVTIKSNDRRTSGIPDMTVVANQKVTWWEFKHWDDDGFDWEGIQHRTCCRLDRESYCRYVVYMKKDRTIRLVQPIKMKEFIDSYGVMGFEDHIESCGMGGYDHYAFVTHLRKVHNL